MTIVPNSYGSDEHATKLEEGNRCHRRAGPGGGQFAPAGQGNCDPRGWGLPDSADDKAGPRSRALRQPGASKTPVSKAFVERLGAAAMSGEKVPVDEYVREVPRTVGEVRALLRKAEKANGLFERVAREVAGAASLKVVRSQEEAEASPGDSFVLAPVKGLERSLAKVVLDYHGDVGKLQDVVRGSIVVNSQKAMDRAMDALGAMAEVVLVKDRATKPLPTGYRDLNLRVRLPDGMIGEVQVLLKPMLKAKGVGHKLYDRFRQLPSVSPAKDHLMRAMQELYSTAWLVATGTAAHTALDRLMRLHV